MSRCITVLFGLLAILVAILAQYLGKGLSLITSIAQAVCTAPVFGMFLLGMLVPRSTAKDAAAGCASAFTFLVYCVVNSYVCKGHHPVCHSFLWLGGISPWYYAAWGSLISLGVGTISALAHAEPGAEAKARIVGLTWVTRKQASVYQSTHVQAANANCASSSAGEAKPLLNSIQ